MHTIDRFYKVHDKFYQTALKEIHYGKKLSHWMWYIFPQLKFLGHSYNSTYYGLENTEEARLFYSDEYLGANLREICHAILECNSDDALELMGYPDNIKLQSSMTLFYKATGDELFKKVLDKFFEGREDPQTTGWLDMFN